MDEIHTIDADSSTLRSNNFQREKSTSNLIGDVESEEEVSCCDPRKSYYRFSGLFFICFLGFGSYFCFDTPGALQDKIIDDMGVNTAGFSMLYSLYSWPNVVLCFVGGFLIDRFFGIRMGTIIFSTIVTVGQIVYAFGALINQYWIMLFGRFLFGIGGESLAVAQNAYTVSWFKGKELNTVFGLQLSMARVGSTANFLTMGPIYSWVEKKEEVGHITLGISLMIAGATCVFSLVCGIFLGVLDRRRSKVLHSKSAVEAAEKIQLKDVFTFPLSFWLLSAICVTYYVTIFPFIGLAKVFFMRKYDYSESTANAVSSIVYIISAVASPVLGLVIDKTGRNIMWVFLATFVTLGCHLTLAFTYLNPFIPMSIMGLAYSLLASALWPMVSLILPDHKLGTAYGIMQSVQNLGLALISMLGGLIVDKKGYLFLEVFYILWLCASLLCIILMWESNASRNGILNLSTKQREALETKDTSDENRRLLED